ncbi:cytosolic Fe-S cluster assembly factor NAR1 [Sporormia fimetaria CBS 119925]|uniref:Nuclear architecture-related protein 1 n=1 Tax=Sporormia fimetaria CBS 119925 TaxID=1340428 RepID=A0A6A6VBQ0_9PLEO|nr:cytosolic Fe-S cluster assembly factor NAR1 [Sporormia fimetaria CBS 119925]
MSAILSADDLNDFISPGVACIKPIETLPAQASEDNSNPYEVTTEDKVAASQPPPPASISLTDCLACSGCVTSAEAVLVSLQSHNEVLTTLDAHPPLHPPWMTHNATSNGYTNGTSGEHGEGKLFVASVSPQSRASIAAVFAVSEREAGNMISQLLSGHQGLSSGGVHGSGFTWVLDTNVVREACLVAAADEVGTALASGSKAPTAGSEGALDTSPQRPILTSACPGWICYAEKTHPYVLPHVSRLKSPQALTGTLIKSVLHRRFNIHPSQIFHVAIMPCFDKKLEASRSELTSHAWLPEDDPSQDAVRDVDCVITARELLHLAAARNISFSDLPRTPLPSSQRVPFPDPKLDAFLFPSHSVDNHSPVAGSSGGYLYHILRTYQAQHPGSEISVSRGRNADVVEYSVARDSETIIKAARFYGFRNIQNLVRRLKPKLSRMPGAAARGAVRRPGGAAANQEAMKEYAYVEVMACPGGCTNGGGQIKVSEVDEIRGWAEDQSEGTTGEVKTTGAKDQKVWLARVDEAYFSADSGSDGDVDMDDTEDTAVEKTRNGDAVDGISRDYIRDVVEHWAGITGVEKTKLLYTSYRAVESDVGKKKQSDVERVAGLASSIGGGW